MRPLALASLALALMACPVVGCQGPATPVAPARVTPAPTAATPLPTPATGKRALLVQTPSSLGLFRDEAADAKAQIAAWAERQGYDVVPVPHAERILTLASAGKALDGVTCGLPLPRWYAQERYAADIGASGAVRSRVSCRWPEAGAETGEATGTDARAAASSEGDAEAPPAGDPISEVAPGEGAGGAAPEEAPPAPPPPCTLHLSIVDGVGLDGKTTARFEAPYDPRVDWRKALGEALGELTRAEDDGAGGMGLLGALRGVEVIEAQPERLAWSVWPARAVDDLPPRAFDQTLTFPGGDGPLRSCFGASTGEELLVAVNAAGRVTRCESRNAEDAAARCACAAFTQHARATGELVGRRAHVGVSFRPADVVTTTSMVVRANLATHLEEEASGDGRPRYRPSVSDRSIDGWQPPNGELVEPCFAQRRDPASQTFRFLVVFDDYGGPTEVQSIDEQSAPISKSELACVREKLMTSRAPCPESPKTSAKVELRLSLKKIGSRPPSVGDVLKGSEAR